MQKHPRQPLPILLAGLAAFLLAPLGPALADGTGTVGPDVTVYSVSGINNYGGAGGFHGYSIGTTSCNIGDQPVNWCDNPGGCSGLGSEQHPVIGQNLYRLKDGRFSQIGSSWLKHGFLSTNSNAGSSCTGPGGQQCTFPPRGGDELGIGCTDTYGAGLNGSRPLGMPAEVNPTTGLFPFPETVVPTSTVVDQRMKVADIDLDPALNAGALYWGEGHYVVDNDALANNAFNNASYRSVSVGPAPNFDLSFTGNTIREQWAFDVWPIQDPAVETIRLSFASDGGTTLEGFNVGRRVTDLGGGMWHYEYVVHNMNSDRAAQALAIDFVDGTTVSNIGFQDYDHHSGEYEPDDGMPISTADWVASFDGGTGVLSWETDTYAVSPHANALRWSTMYNFWFDADAAPDQIEIHTLGLFKPGTPAAIPFWGEQFTLTAAAVGSGSVTSNPPGIDCPADCSESYFSGTVVELTATPAAGWQFAGWSGDCSGTGACSLTLDADRNVTATFEQITWTLDVSVTGPGSVTSSPPGIDCPGDCSELFPDATPVTLNAIPDPGARLISWGGDCSGGGACQVTMSAGRTVSATFDTMPFVDGFESGDTSAWSFTTP